MLVQGSLASRVARETVSVEGEFREPAHELLGRQRLGEQIALQLIAVEARELAGRRA
jgi:hypothetical protein